MGKVKFMTSDEINKRLKELLGISDQEYEKISLAYENEIVSIYKNVLKEIKVKIANIFEKLGDDVTYSDMMLYNRLTNLEKQIAEQIKNLTNDVIKTTKEKLSYFFSESFNLSSYAIEKSLGIELGFGIIDPLTIETAWKNQLTKISWPKSMQDHAQQYVNAIRSELTQGLIQGKGYAKIAAAITEKTGINAGKVLRIVRTEGHRVQNIAREISYSNAMQSAERLGLKMVKVWVATLDNKTRDSHASMDGQEADDEGMFTYPGGDKTPAPGVQGPPEEVINCRCTTTMQLKDFPPKFRRDQETGNIIEYQSFADWKKKKGIA